MSSENKKGNHGVCQGHTLGGGSVLVSYLRSRGAILQIAVYQSFRRGDM